MERQKRWQWALILVVFALTLYNIIPTLIYYARPLSRAVGPTEGMEAAESALQRLSHLEEDGVAWLRSYCNLFQIKPLSISIDPKAPQRFLIECAKAEEAALLRRSLARAGAQIPFVPAQMAPLLSDAKTKTVSVIRKIGVRFDRDALPRYFSFTPKWQEDGSIAPLFQETVLDRAAQLASAAAGPGECAQIFRAIQAGGPQDELLFALAAKIRGSADLLPSFATSMTAGSSAPSQELDRLSVAIDALRDRLKIERVALKQNQDGEAVRLIEQKEALLFSAQQFMKKEREAFLRPLSPLSFHEALSRLTGSPKSIPLDASPFFSELTIDWERGEMSLLLRPDLEGKRSEIHQLLINEIARISRASHETILPEEGVFTVRLHENPEASSFLVFHLDELAKDGTANLLALLKEEWRPKHPDLLSLHFPIVDSRAFGAMSEREQALCLCVFSPAASPLPVESLNQGSLYLLAKGFDRIFEQSKESDAPSSALLQSDLNALSELLRQSGFRAYSLPGSSDMLFEQPLFFGTVLAATREEFLAKGSLRFALLEFTDLEQRLLVQNRIDTEIHEELLQWQDEYNRARLGAVPKPTKSPFLSNIALSLKKYFRGDERKILRWGLDLSGGKTVQIELRDQNHKPVSSEEDLKQGINELYSRVNKMGVSEVAIRQLGKQIVLDFPGSQAMKASELIKASSMYFHIVNEKFSSFSPQLSEATNRFLQEVWNEAVVMNRTDPESVHAIAWDHLQGGGDRPRSDAARTLFEEGLRLQPPSEPACSSALETALSKIALFRDAEGALQGQGHPLLIVFANYALEGSSLSNIRASYDETKGNFLGFDINRSGQAALSQWTSRYSQEGVSGRPEENDSRGAGWRMAVLLNQSVISAPTLHSSLKDSAMISGSFTPREASLLAADLKAGSLTFTPHILSEKNVSPELGKSDRVKGIASTVAALFLVIGAMVCYYRFSGVIASIAVMANLLILWATLQNLQATLSLAGIAGIILTVGMAVDANVLVFERIKEELSLGKGLASAIKAGYQKAFSAILDSNVTTIIAALILLNFDAGPIKGFAITLIIGIASSMFTALFMTKVYFNRWASKTKATTLSMANWIRSSSFDFLKASKGAILASLLLIAAGGFFFIQQRTTLFGMDFTGGYAIELEVVDSGEPAAAVSLAFQQAGASPREFQIRQLQPDSRLRILFSTAMELPGRPFESGSGQIGWILNALEKESIHLTPESLAAVESSWVAISGQMSDTMRNNALLGLALAFGCIFIYLAIRFESGYAASAILCLIHDVAVTLGFMGLLHACGIPVQIDLNTIAALMTIIGYSLNDTIIIFDRIREDVSFAKTKPLVQIVNHAINATLSRTAITSGTTLLVLLALVALGGPSIFSFALVMTIGVFFGTLSSWFIAAPLLLAFHRKKSLGIASL